MLGPRLRPDGERPGRGSAGASDAALLEVREVAFAYSGIPALDGVDLHVGAGEAVCIVGPNGAGKTTLAKVICGLLRPDAGDVRLAGDSLVRLRAHRVATRGVAIVLEGRHVFAEQSVRANLELGAYWRRPSRATLDAEFARVFELFPDLERFAATPAGALSGGQQQMLCVGRALMGAPRLMILDEPSMGLSPKLAGELYAAMDRLRAEGLTILLIEQNAELAFRFCTRGYLLQHGRAVLEGTVAELRATDLVRRIYLGGERAERAAPSAPVPGARAHEKEAR